MPPFGHSNSRYADAAASSRHPTMPIQPLGSCPMIEDIAAPVRAHVRLVRPPKIMNGQG